VPEWGDKSSLSRALVNETYPINWRCQWSRGDVGGGGPLLPVCSLRNTKSPHTKSVLRSFLPLSTVQTVVWSYGRDDLCK